MFLREPPPPPPPPQARLPFQMNIQFIKKGRYSFRVPGSSSLMSIMLKGLDSMWYLMPQAK